MNISNTIIKKQKIFLSLSGLFLIISVVFILLWGNTNLFLTINQNYNEILDDIFLALTRVADKSIAMMLIIVLLSQSKKKGIGLLLSFILSATITQSLKKIFFATTLRPASIFQNSITQLHFVFGEEIDYLYSFPSGHTTTIFCLATFFSYHSKHKVYQIIFLLLAALSAYSRIYLGQHFPKDVIAGSLIGFGASMIVCYVLENPKIIPQKIRDFFC